MSSVDVGRVQAGLGTCGLSASPVGVASPSCGSGHHQDGGRHCRATTHPQTPEGLLSNLDQVWGKNCCCLMVFGYKKKV